MDIISAITNGNRDMAVLIWTAESVYYKRVEFVAKPHSFVLLFVIKIGNQIYLKPSKNILNDLIL